jgi:hypothetical protein
MPTYYIKAPFGAFIFLDNCPLPHTDVKAAKFSMQVEWGINQFAGYLNTWSGFRNL